MTELFTLAPTRVPTDVIMVRPHHFRPNPWTAGDNGFQATDPSRSSAEVAADAYAEVGAVAEALRTEGVYVTLFDDEGDTLPDSVFPNNWFSTHSDGRVVLYPMFSPNRRGERRADVLDVLRADYCVSRVVDYSTWESQQMYLEGTGAMVLDHVTRIAYIARSHRADDRAVSRVCADLGYEPVVFATTDRRGVPIYHTNVMMCVASTFALVGLDTILDPAERALVTRRLEGSGRTVVPLTQEQIDNFAGNALELHGAGGPVLVMSQRARDSLTAEQVAVIESHARIRSVPIPTIELAGGSVRCMIAEVHLQSRSAAATPVAS